RRGGAPEADVGEAQAHRDVALVDRGRGGGERGQVVEGGRVARELRAQLLVRVDRHVGLLERAGRARHRRSGRERARGGWDAHRLGGEVVGAEVAGGRI